MQHHTGFLSRLAPDMVMDSSGNVMFNHWGVQRLKPNKPTYVVYLIAGLIGFYFAVALPHLFENPYWLIFW